MASAVASRCCGGCSALAVSRGGKVRWNSAGSICQPPLWSRAALILPALMCLSTVDLLMLGGCCGGRKIIHGGCSLLLRGLRRGYTCMVKTSFARLRFRRDCNAGQP